MNPALLTFIMEALEKGVPMAINLYHDISDSIASSNELDAEAKVNLLNRLNKAYLPERNFVQG